MRLTHNAHLAYCTNVHPGNDWSQTFLSLQNEVMAVRQNVCPDDDYAIGLRLSASAAQELSQRPTLAHFQTWLEQNRCYVFTINGFPYGNFHGERVKENAYRPDWTSPDRLAYTKLLFDLLAQFVPRGSSGSVSTVPASFKSFISSDDQLATIHENLYQVYQHIDSLSDKHGLDLHLGLEPEPLCLLETTPETLRFFEKFVAHRSDQDRILQRIGVNYDTCHLALQYEEAKESLTLLQKNNIRISKIHLSSALKVRDFSDPTLAQLDAFCEPTYLHQVIAQDKSDPSPHRYEDLPEALRARRAGSDTAEEWRIHFHIPLHAEPAAPLLSTADHLLETLDTIAAQPQLCQHFEMETYTWGVMPETLHSVSVVEQVTREYQWLLPQLKARHLR